MLRALGIAQLMFLVIFIFYYSVGEPIFGYMTEAEFELYGPQISAIRSIFVIFVCAFIIVSTLYAFYSRLKYFILFGVLGAVSDLFEKISPILFITGPYDLHFSFFTFFTMILFSSIIFLSILCMVATKYKEEAQIRKEILELGTKYPDFKVKNISKNCGSDNNTIINVVKKMIKNKEIYADYFKISKKFVFNNRANAEEIDKLMEMFSDWETEHMGKKV